jgi:chromosome segregation ATPase
MEDDKRVNYKLDAISKLINNLKLSISGNKDHEELGENNVIVNLDEISQKITELHQMVKSEFDEFEEQHKSESDETQDLLTEKFAEIKTELVNIRSTITALKTSMDEKLTTIDTDIKNMSSALQGKFNALIAAVNGMKASNDTKNDAIIAALQGLVTQVNRNTSNINSLDDRVDDLEQD